MEETNSSLTFPLPTHTSENGKKYISVPHSKRNPNLLLFAQFIHDVKCRDWLNLILKKFTPHLADLSVNDLDVEEVSQALSNIDDILLKIENLSVEVTQQTLLFADSLPIVKEENAEVTKKFASANSLEEAFSEYEELELVSSTLAMLDPKQADILQASIACHMAGLTKPAQTLLEQFVFNEFLHGNELYYLLSLDIESNLSKKRSAKEAAKNGNNSRHRINRLVKEKAIQLYSKGTFHNPRHAAKQLLPQVTSIAADLGSSLEWENNGFTRLYEWLRKAKKA